MLQPHILNDTIPQIFFSQNTKLTTNSHVINWLKATNEIGIQHILTKTPFIIMKNILLYFWTSRVSNRQRTKQRNKCPNCEFILRTCKINHFKMSLKFHAQKPPEKRLLCRTWCRQENIMKKYIWSIGYKEMNSSETLQNRGNEH